MSRSNPTADMTHPCTRWHEWHGDGHVTYYDKKQKDSPNRGNVNLGSKFPFILLEQTSCITGWHHGSSSNVVSNEVKNTLTDVLSVRSFKGGPIATGLYRDIKDKITSKANGGKYTRNLYIAYKPAKDQPLAIGSLKLSGDSSFVWSEFYKENENAIKNTHGVVIDGAIYKSTGTGKSMIEWNIPVFKLIPISEESNQQAVNLDILLQQYLKVYFGKGSSAQATTGTADDQVQEDAPTDYPTSKRQQPAAGEPAPEVPPDDEDVPF